MMTDLERVREHIEHHGIYRAPPGTQLVGKAPNTFYTWQFYLRRTLHDVQMLPLVAKLLAERLDLRGVQLGACESAGVSLAVALGLLTGTSFFTIKQTPKAYGLMNNVEGPIIDAPVLLIDDLAGSQATLRRAAAIITGGLQLPLAKQYAVVVNKTVGTHQVYLEELELVNLFACEDFTLRWHEYVAKYGKDPDFGKVY